jgi:transposase-like protein
MSTLTKKDFLETIERLWRYIKIPFCKHKKHYLIKSTKDGTLITHYWKCVNCEKTFITYFDTRYDY